MRSFLACSTTTLALGSRQLAQQGAIVTRLTAIEEMAGMTLLCSDKTGTLTLNTMVIQVCPLDLIQQMASICSCRVVGCWTSVMNVVAQCVVLPSPLISTEQCSCSWCYAL